MHQLRSKVLGVDAVLHNDNLEWDLDTCWEVMQQACDGLADSLGEHCLGQALEGFDVGSLVRACPDEAREGFKALKYARWFQPSRDRPSCLHMLPEAGNVRVLAQFRCAAHHLNCEAGREMGPRSTRLCLYCHLQEVEDEVHILVCPAWESLRVTFQSLFEWDTYLALTTAIDQGGDVDEAAWQFFNSMDVGKVDLFAGYLKKVFAARRSGNS